MSKFAFVIEITKSGEAKGYAFKKEDGQKAKELFTKFRDEGKEAYYYQHPNPDKRCKSEAQMEASKGTEGTVEAQVNRSVSEAKPEVIPATPKSNIKAVSLDDDMEILPNPSKGKNSIGGL